MPSWGFDAVPFHHVTVMRAEAVRFLDCRPGRIIVDCTLGGAGHARSILENIIPGGRFIGIDQDPDAIHQAEQVLAPYAADVHLFNGNYSRIGQFLAEVGLSRVDGILADLGLSLHQLDGSGRGFSFQKDEPLDMRMSPEIKTTAGDVVNKATEDRLRTIFTKFGEQPRAGRIARRIVNIRKKEPIRTSRQLADIVRKAVPGGGRPGRIHPATRVFMALRIAVNRELEHLETFMDQAVDLLNPGGRLCVISFHSLEDRIVKQKLKSLAKGCECPGNLPQCVCGKTPAIEILTRKPLGPGSEEVAANPMARSARMRAAVRLGAAGRDGALDESDTNGNLLK